MSGLRLHGRESCNFTLNVVFIRSFDFCNKATYILSMLQLFLSMIQEVLAEIWQVVVFMCKKVSLKEAIKCSFCAIRRKLNTFRCFAGLR